MNSKVIAIDFDGVIADSDFAKLNFARNYLELEVSERDMKERYFLKLFGVERGHSIYSQIIRNICHSEKMLQVPMMPLSLEGIEKLSNAGWQCVVVTSRHGDKNDKGSAAYWAWRYLEINGYKIEKKNFFNVSDNSKLDVCLKINSRGLIDDDYFKISPIINAGDLPPLYVPPTKLVQPVVEHRWLPVPGDDNPKHYVV